MSAPPDKESRLCAMFDSYCKTVIRNASKNLKGARANQAKHRTVDNDQIQYLFDTQDHTYTYPSDQLTIHADKFSCVVFDGTLYEAMLACSQNSTRNCGT